MGLQHKATGGDVRDRASTGSAEAGNDLTVGRKSPTIKQGYTASNGGANIALMNREGYALQDSCDSASRKK